MAWLFNSLHLWVCVLLKMFFWDCAILVWNPSQDFGCCLYFWRDPSNHIKYRDCSIWDQIRYHQGWNQPFSGGITGHSAFDPSRSLLGIYPTAFPYISTVDILGSCGNLQRFCVPSQILLFGVLYKCQGGWGINLCLVVSWLCCFTCRSYVYTDLLYYRDMEQFR